MQAVVRWGQVNFNFSYDIIPLGGGVGYLKRTPTILSLLWGTYGTVSRTPDYQVNEDVTSVKVTNVT